MTYPDAVLIQFLSHPGAIGIYYLSDQQFISDGDDTGNYLFHVVKITQ
jgi:hypothetical protein